MTLFRSRRLNPSTPTRILLLVILAVTWPFAWLMDALNSFFKALGRALEAAGEELNRQDNGGYL